MTHTPFNYFEYDVNKVLPLEWDSMIKQLVEKHRKLNSASSQSSVSREKTGDDNSGLYMVNGPIILNELPWLYELYRGRFRDLAQKNFSEEVLIASDPNSSMVIFEQEGRNMRLAAHVDPNPVTGILYVTTQPEGSGGELVVSNRAESSKDEIRGIKEIEKDSTKILPVRGKLVFFDVRDRPHFTKSLTSDNDVRIVVGMNYYTPSCTEKDIPDDASGHYVKLTLER